MIQSHSPLPNPARSLLEDLVLRTGLPTTESLSPYSGMQHVLFDQFKGRLSSVDLQFVFDRLREEDDYDADKQRPVAGPWRLERTSSNAYLRRMEDIDESWVQKYLENVLTGIKINRSGGIREYESSNRETRTLTDSEGSSVDEGELLIGSYDYTPMDVTKAADKLPYLLKRMFDKSLQLGISAMSLIIAYEKARRQSDAVGGVRPRHILGNTVYYMNANGQLDGVLPSTANSGKKFPPACDWILGKDRDSYFQDAMELLDVCDTLGIDITQEDPQDYQAEQIQKLKITYITKNREYLRGMRPRNLSVLDALAGATVSGQIKPEPPGGTLGDLARDMVQALLDSTTDVIVGIRNTSPDSQSINTFFRSFAAVTPKFRVSARSRALQSPARIPNLYKYSDVPNCVPLLSDFKTRDGFLCSRRDDQLPYIFDLTPYVSDLGGERFGILHVSGYFFLLTDSPHVHYLDVLELACYVDDYKRGQFGNRYTQGHKYGWWDVCLV